MPRSSSLLHAVCAVLVVLIPIGRAAADGDLGPVGSDSASLDAAADALWRQRADGAVGARPNPSRVERLVEAHEQAVAGSPRDLERRWKLLRALHFQGEHSLRDQHDRLALYEQARGVADESRALLADRIGRPLDDLEPFEIAEALAAVPAAAELYLYSAIHWGLWGDTTGKLKAARQGVGGKIRDFAAVVVLLDERFDSAGGHRFLGRLHTEAPRIPFVTGWIDRAVAIQELERAVELGPEEPYNMVFLADALLRFDPDRSREAIEMLERVIAQVPRADRLVEDAAAAIEARELLAGTRD